MITSAGGLFATTDGIPVINPVVAPMLNPAGNPDCVNLYTVDPPAAVTGVKLVAIFLVNVGITVINAVDNGGAAAALIVIEYAADPPSEGSALSATCIEKL